MRFPTAIAAMRDGGSIRAAILVRLDFKTAPKAVHLGNGNIITLDGTVWTGLGDVISIEGGGQAAGMVAPQMIFTVPATREMLDLADDTANEVYGRFIGVALQFIDENWQAVDSPRVIFTGIMDHMRSQIGRNGTASLKLIAESPFVRRATAIVKSFTDADHQAQYPGDRFFEFVPGLKDKKLAWPVFV
jgi:hypothetical protein